jgi:endoglucanase
MDSRLRGNDDERENKMLGNPMIYASIVALALPLPALAEDCQGLQIGVNLAGPEFGPPRGRYGYTYIYPNEAELDYFTGKNLRLIRLPLRWETLQPVLDGPLDPAELGRVAEFLHLAQAKGAKVLIDLHNYGRYDNAVLGSPGLPDSAFADVWAKLAEALHGAPALWGYGLMNEPHDMGGPAVWPAAAQAAIAAIRRVDAATPIVVAGDGWSGAVRWDSVNGELAHQLQDPAHKLVFEAHAYLDHDGSGSYRGDYDAEKASPTTGTDRLKPFLAWLEDQHAQGIIGEMGVPGNDPRWLTALDNSLMALCQHHVPLTYWAAGPWWGPNYSQSIEPDHGHDRPQMQIIERYIHK